LLYKFSITQKHCNTITYARASESLTCIAQCPPPSTARDMISGLPMVETEIDYKITYHSFRTQCSLDKICNCNSTYKRGLRDKQALSAPSARELRNSTRLDLKFSTSAAFNNFKCKIYNVLYNYIVKLEHQGFKKWEHQTHFRGLGRET
jgi:hypothetical protein